MKVGDIVVDSTRGSINILVSDEEVRKYSLENIGFYDEDLFEIVTAKVWIKEVARGNRKGRIWQQEKSKLKVIARRYGNLLYL